MSTLNNEEKYEQVESSVEQIEGNIEDIIYKNESNGYCVCEMAIDEFDIITVVGTLPYISVGEHIKAVGRWDVHPTYGKQFKIENYEKELPNTKESIEKYLASRAIKGVGPKTAQRIVEKFGEDSFDIIENHPEWLCDVPGISKSKAEEISEEFKKQFGFRSVAMFCKDFFGPATSVKVFKKWGGAAIDVIKENPYALCGEIFGIGFERADRIAATLGTPKDSSFRLMAAIKYLLDFNAMNSGHCFIPKHNLIPLAQQMLDVDNEKVVDAVDTLIKRGELICPARGGREDVYLKKYYDAELYSAKKLVLLENLALELETSDVQRIIDQAAACSGIEYDKEQKKAINTAMKTGVMVLTGGPGTGKTTVIRAIIQAFEGLGLKLQLAAPTGRAAKRMSEATSHSAKTIHRMLEMEYREDEDNIRFSRNENNLLEEDVFIIDEVSMVDIILMSSLLKAIKPGARIILVGDADQLPSVGAGDVLRDIIASDRFTTVTLTNIFRQEEESRIVTNAHSINAGELPYLENTHSDDFFFIDREEDKNTALTIVDLCKKRLPKKYGANIIDSIQVISPSRKGESGTLMLNNYLQEALNPYSPKKKERKLEKDVKIRVGDRVMQRKNNYDIPWVREDGYEGQGVFNGDIGVVIDIDNEVENVTVIFDDKKVVYDFSNIDELELSYAITVHKSQGSEYPIVIIPMCNFAPQLLTRNLLYTAITRAQKMVILVGRKDIVQRMVENNAKKRRFTALSSILESSAE